MKNTDGTQVPVLEIDGEYRRAFSMPLTKPQKNKA